MGRKDTGTKKQHSTTAPKQGGGEGLLLKLTWYGILIFLIFLFIRQYPADATAKKATAKFSFSGFFNGFYQNQLEKKLLSKPFFVSLNKYRNEYDLSLFEKVNLEDSYMGKEDYIFGRAMTKATFGDDYWGDEHIVSQVTKAKLVQDKLKEMGVELLVLLAPGKSTYHPEYLPDDVSNTKKKPTNKAKYKEEFIQQGIHHIDFTDYFLRLKDTTRYPLFPQYGSHWSYYGECIAIDTTIKKLESLMNINLPNIIFSQVAMDTARVRDADIYRKIPMHQMPVGKMLAYPQSIGYSQGFPQKIIAIGDSYFRGFFYLGAMENAFAGSQQWYYYNSIIPESPNNPEVWELDLYNEISKVKAILLMCNEFNLKNLGNGFIDDAYELFSNPEQYKKRKQQKNQLNAYKKQIRKNDDQLSELIKQSYYRSISLDSIISEKAWMLSGNR